MHIILASPHLVKTPDLDLSLIEHTTLVENFGFFVFYIDEKALFVPTGQI